MNNSKILLAVGILLSLIFISCQDLFPDPEVPVQDAVKLTKSELKNTTGYEWFNGYWTLYKPDATIADEISLTFDTTIHKIIIFIEPQCSCKELVRTPADLVKVLDIANISEEYYEIYSMGSVKSKHPFEDKLTIKSLPQVHLLKSGEFVYSVLDTFDFYSARNQSTTIESIILKALKDN